MGVNSGFYSLYLCWRKSLACPPLNLQRRAQPHYHGRAIQHPSFGLGGPVPQTRRLRLTPLRDRVQLAMTEQAAAQARQLLDSWLSNRLAGDVLSWLQQAMGSAATKSRHSFYLAFGMVPRKTGKGDLALSADELAAAQQARPGWDPSGWSIDQAARTRLVLAVPEHNVNTYLETLDKLFNAGDMGELVALYQMLPLLPYPESHKLRAAEGVRSNIKAVFCAVAHRNPYPAEQLDEGAWNQMVLKCLFIGVPLAPVTGLDARANPRLMQMLCDYAHERWAAGREVSPELWRCVGPHADKAALADLQHVLEEGTEVERQAAALALSACPAPQAADILKGWPELAEQAAQGAFTWDTIAQAAEA